VLSPQHPILGWAAPQNEEEGMVVIDVVQAGIRNSEDSSVHRPVSEVMTLIIYEPPFFNKRRVHRTSKAKSGCHEPRYTQEGK
jgi:hypothetical protein